MRFAVMRYAYRGAEIDIDTDMTINARAHFHTCTCMMEAFLKGAGDRGSSKNKSKKTRDIQEKRILPWVEK